MILDKIIEATKIRVAQEKQVESPEAVKAAALALPSDTGISFLKQPFVSKTSTLFAK